MEGNGRQDKVTSGWKSDGMPRQRNLKSMKSREKVMIQDQALRAVSMSIYSHQRACSRACFLQRAGIGPLRTFHAEVERNDDSLRLSQHVGSAPVLQVQTQSTLSTATRIAPRRSVSERPSALPPCQKRRGAQSRGSGRSRHRLYQRAQSNPMHIRQAHCAIWWKQRTTVLL